MSSLYSPYRAIGYVCDNNAFCVNRLGEEIFLTVSIGKCFQVLRLNKLVACLVSKAVSGPIGALQVIGHETFVVVDRSIIVFDRASVVRTYDVHTHCIVGLLTIGNNLISFDKSNQVKIHDTKERKLVGELTMLQSGTITAIVHPATYVNKFVVGFSNGQLELWNFNSRKLLHTFTSHASVVAADAHTAAPSVTCLEQSPACDVIAVGFGDGHIVLLNLKLDQVLFSFLQKGGAVTSLSFRTDAGAERCPFLASSSADGRIHIWNLGSNRPASAEDGGLGQLKVKLDRRLQSSLEEAHSGPVSRVVFLPGEPLLVSAGAHENCVKVWIFDAPDGTARLLRSREGHRGAPSRIRYYGGSTHVSMRDNADGFSCEMVSAGTDGSLRLFNTALEAQNRELSQKPLLKKLGLQRRNERLPRCLGFDFSETRQRDWGNLVTIHEDTASAYVWNFRHRVATEMVLKQPHWQDNARKHSADKSTHASAVALSPCGNFAVVGTRGGALYRYNLQSGLPRGSYPRTAETAQALSIIAKKTQIPGNIYHDMKQVRGEAVVPLNAKPEDAKSAQDNQAQSAQVALQEGHRGEVAGVFIDMLGVTLASCGYDGSVCFWDFNTQELVERVALGCPQVLLQGFRDAGFFAVAGQDRVLRVFDMATRKLSRRFAGGHSREVTDLAFSPDGRRLLSAALDSTLRVWDLPSGRCLNWLQFPSPILSMAVSLSGEYLCLAQAEKEGIYMYIDRSLYETVHFWKEPTIPTPVADSLVLASTEEVQAEEGGGERGGAEAVEGDMAVAVTAPQAQVDDREGAAREGTEQRGGSGVVTMAAVPRAYWTSLFNLEAIKLRNKPTAAPAPAVKAPFFLPSVVRAGGSAPSFPTPAEYAKLTSELKTGAEAGDKREASSSVGDALPLSKRAKVDTLGDAALSEEAVLQELAGMGSAWTDSADWASSSAGHSGGGGSAEEVSWALDTAAPSAGAAEEGGNAKESRRSKSRIISRRTQLPRCKLMAYLVAEQEQGDGGARAEALLGYLKQLPPPAVDLELRALCTHAEDAEGVALLVQLLRWLAEHIASGDNFEVLQAYLHRTLAIYLPLAAAVPALGPELKALAAAHQQAASRFRHLVQKNLCLLKVMANLPVG